MYLDKATLPTNKSRDHLFEEAESEDPEDQSRSATKKRKFQEQHDDDSSEDDTMNEHRLASFTTWRRKLLRQARTHPDNSKIFSTSKL